jgi:hypothetical protein
MAGAIGVVALTSAIGPVELAIVGADRRSMTV